MISLSKAMSADTTNKVKAIIYKALLPKSVVYRYLNFVIVKSGHQEDNLKIVTSLAEQRLKHFNRPNSPTQQFFNNVRDNFSTAENPSIGAAVAPYLNDLEQTIVHTSKDAIGAFEQILAYQGRSSELREKLFNAMIMPLIYIGMIIVIANATNESVVQVMVGIVESSGNQATGMLGTLKSVNNAIIDLQWLLVPTILGIVMAYKKALSQLSGNTRLLCEKIWLLGLPFNIHRDVTAASTLDTLATLFNAGQNVEQALTTLKSGSFPYLAKEIEEIQNQFNIIGNLGESLKCQLFKSEVSYLLANYITSDNATTHMTTVAEEINKAVAKKVGVIAHFVNISGLIVVVSYVILVVFANLSMKSQF
ncbi:type II secretion system F family protein [Vibrio fluvialis]|nr:type II secretion system F family protein [Vibrio fluvialis]MBY7902396.1 type II secretion system F family protein [Vibrio fluvialis]